MHRLTLLMAAALFGLAACGTGNSTATPDAPAQAEVPPPPEMTPPEPDMDYSEPEARCNADAAQWAVGEASSEELLERARNDAGADIARFIDFDTMVTMEYHESRLNLYLAEDGTVERVTCG